MSGMTPTRQAPLPSRSHPPALKRGTFYFAKKRNFLFCVDRCMNFRCMNFRFP
jgi:hypothetical protein